MDASITPLRHSGLSLVQTTDFFYPLVEDPSKQGSYEFSKPTPKYKLAGGGGGSLGDAVAPMPGVIEKVMVEDGSVVEAGDPLIIMIAMKMEYVIKAPKA